MTNKIPQEVSPALLLCREERSIDDPGVISLYKNKTILVTGGGGSIGSEICRQLASLNPKRIVIFDIYENTAYELFCELRDIYGESDTEFIVEIGSVRDSARMIDLFDTYMPDVVFHASAHKHVPLMEHNPREAVLNNVFGTLEAMRQSQRCGVERFVFISTDKAVNPTSVMGATKRVGEMLISLFPSSGKTIYSAVRFGNVLGSHGSVLPLFEKQIKAGGPLKVTHREITRYFMTIPEAARLVVISSVIAKGGEIFVLDMGEPVRIYDMAKRYIELSGLIPGVDIDLEIIGLRPGEKLYEELFMDSENANPTDVEGIFVSSNIPVDAAAVNEGLELLQESVRSEKSEHIIDALKKIVPTYASLRK